MQILVDGVLVRMLRDGAPFVAFRFETEGIGLACAEDERQRLIADGWS